MKRGAEPEVDHLYRLPLNEFTRARNALATTMSGSRKKDIASLVKPSFPMWVINQLYWQDAPAYNALIDAAEKLRTAHRAVLTGRKADTRQAEQLHRTTVEKALAKSIDIADRSGVRLSDAVRETVRRTLAALPGDEPAGRLTRAPEPAGFSLLTGIKPRPAARRPPQRDTHAQKEAERRARKEAVAAQQAQEKREREIRKAEQALREAERRLAALKG